MYKSLFGVDCMEITIHVNLQWRPLPLRGFSPVHESLHESFADDFVESVSSRYVLGTKPTAEDIVGCDCALGSSVLVEDVEHLAALRRPDFGHCLH